MGRRVAIAGVALSGMPGSPEATPYALHAQASRAALFESGLKPSDIDGFASAGLGALQPLDVAEYMGLRPRWVDSTGVGGATWEVMAAHAADAIAQGRADVVLLSYGSTARTDLRKKLRTANLDWGTRGPQQFEAPFGHTLIAKYAMAARRHMHEYGTTLEQLAEIAVSARYNASLTPFASFRELIDIATVLDGPMIADPFTKLQCCIRSDGGAAVVMVAEDRVPDLDVKPVWVLGSAEAGSHVAMSQWEDFTVSPAAMTGPAAERSTSGTNLNESGVPLLIRSTIRRSPAVRRVCAKAPPERAVSRGIIIRARDESFIRFPSTSVRTISAV